MTRLDSVASACVAGALLIAGATGAQSIQAIEPPAGQTAHDHDHAADTTVETGEAQASVMDAEAIEAELDLLVTRMSNSEGKSKIEAMEELLTALVRQHRAGCAARTRAPGEAPGGCCHDSTDEAEKEAGTDATRRE